ncbi:dephospho-CoA kinase [Arachidicoccus soli]|uniref:Dephospho-CoA kinase n=1 Tax=Arachidicoccus soli TaxID=2341117 RepID=A0A386HMR3_9BACT|nr:dephospho-CoA kinase [Arachidicoccus soli]AYD46634.1 dephospho-CoA kinase [Arachidicoccus soli]
MLKIGLTGGIGSGKSTVAKIFNTLGIPTFDADAAAKNIMENDAKVKAQLINAFGKEIFAQNLLNKKYLAEIVFKDAAKLKLLNNITHPATIEAAKNWIDEQSTPYVIKEAALLFEAKSAGDLDFIIGVQSPIQLRIQRAMRRSNISEEAVMQRIEKQMDNDEKMQLCDFVILNDEQQALLPQVLTLNGKFVDNAIKKS